MEIKVEKLTDVNLLRKANSFTTGRDSKMSLLNCYKAMHSNARTQIFWIEMRDIPLFVASHLVRHVHTQPYQLSKRDDRNPNAIDLGRKTPTDLALLLNAEEIVNISLKRLCMNASKETREIWEKVLEEVLKVDPDLYLFCVPPCVYKGYCSEPKPCGYTKSEVYKEDRKTFLKLFEQ